MADQARLQALLEQLNDALGDVTPYKLAVVDPASIRPVDKNAHYMPKRVFDQLAANVQRDGNLSSLPFCWRHPDGELESMSGNHRVQVAAGAEVPLILVLYTDANLSKPERLAIQLSHNALVGQDNPGTLREIWTEIDDLSLKVYSGLDERLLETMAPIAITRIDDAQLKFEELAILFLPSEIDRMQDTLGRLGKTSRRRFAARLEDFDRFFEALLGFKEAAEIVNTGTAMLAMIGIIEQWLDEHNGDEHE